MLTEPGAKAGTWMIVEDDSQITFRFDPSGRSVEFVFFGQCELSVGMSASVIRRCQDLFSQASAQLGCTQQVTNGVDRDAPPRDATTTVHELDGIIAPARRVAADMTLTGTYEPSPQGYVRDQVEAYERSGGTEANTMRGKPVTILTTLGAKSGKLRKTPLMRVEHNGRYAVVASLGGAPKHPVWYYNIVAHPTVELQDGPAKYELVAREVTGDEKAEWWDRAVEAWPDYAEYQKKTDRQIPVFVLEPRAG